jgi:hypothetical protein
LTFCNVALKDAIDNRPSKWFDGQYGFKLNELSLDLTAIWPTIRELWTYDIKTDYKAALKAIYQGRVKRVTLHEAYKLAKRGEVVIIISAKYGHEAAVYPDQRPWVEERGPTIAQAGKWNCITDCSHRWTFGKYWRDPEILFIHLERRGTKWN